jgi:hypothetical protein
MYVNNESSVALPQTNKKFFLLFFLCCSLPLVTAKLALEFSWFTAGVTNKGQWLEEGVQIFPAIHNQQHWQLVYVQTQRCDSSCELALYTLQQIYTGFGRQQEQLNLSIVASQAPSQLTHYPAIHWQTSNVPLQELQDHILIVNQEGLAILRYPVVKNSENMITIGKDIRTDLRRLMVYDRGRI